MASLDHAGLQLLQNFIQITTYAEFNSKAEDIRKVLEAQMFGRNSDPTLISPIKIIKNNILIKLLPNNKKMISFKNMMHYMIYVMQG